MNLDANGEILQFYIINHYHSYYVMSYLVETIEPQSKQIETEVHRITQRNFHRINLPCLYHQSSWV